MQWVFQFGKELGFEVLQLKEWVSIFFLFKGWVFEEVINYFKVIYFFVVLYIFYDFVIVDMRVFFVQFKWDGEVFLSIMKKYEVIFEMFYYCFINILFCFFEMGKLFFLCFLYDLEEDIFEIDKEFYLSWCYYLYGNGLFEYYCWCWVVLLLFKDFFQMQWEGKYVDNIVCVQWFRYMGMVDEYFCLMIVWLVYFLFDQNVSVIIGILIILEVKKWIVFFEDLAIQFCEVNKICECCLVLDCVECVVVFKVVICRENLKWIQACLQDLEGVVY